MDKRLNFERLTNVMDKTGLSQADLARQLSISRESVRKWFSGESFPRPDKLLRLGKLLGLTFSELVIKEEPSAPVVAFRKVRGAKTKDHHIAHAQTMGRMLRHLVSYLPFDILSMPPVLKEPRCEYKYLQNAASLIRQEIHVEPTETINFSHLIRHFGKLQAVIVPVMWGSKQRHENATHIYLPDSQTTWVYLNLDVNVHDFKFWMAHELGHCLAPQLRDEEAEDFADAFAGTLLFPDRLASTAYKTIHNLSGKRAQLQQIINLADEHIISPYSIYAQINFYAESTGLPPLQLEPDIYAWTTRFNQEYMNVSNTLFDDNMPPEPETYMEVGANTFETPFFEILRQYLKEQRKGPGFVQTIMDIPLLDARSLHDVLT